MADTDTGVHRRRTPQARGWAITAALVTAGLVALGVAGGEPGLFVIVAATAALIVAAVRSSIWAAVAAAGGALIMGVLMTTPTTAGPTGKAVVAIREFGPAGANAARTGVQHLPTPHVAPPTEPPTTTTVPPPAAP